MINHSTLVIHLLQVTQCVIKLCGQIGRSKRAPLLLNRILDKCPNSVLVEDKVQITASFIYFQFLTLSRQLDHDWNTGLQPMKHDKMQRMKHETPRLTHEMPRLTHEMPRLTTKFFARISNRQLIKLAVRVRVNDANFTLRVWNARDRATSQTLFVMIWDFEFYNF